MKKLIEGIKVNFRGYIIAGFVTSFLAIFVHLRHNSPPRFEYYFLSLPFIWLGLFLLMLFFIIFLDD